MSQMYVPLGCSKGSNVTHVSDTGLQHSKCFNVCQGENRTPKCLRQKTADLQLVITEKNVCRYVLHKRKFSLSKRHLPTIVLKKIKHVFH